MNMNRDNQYEMTTSIGINEEQYQTIPAICSSEPLYLEPIKSTDVRSGSVTKAPAVNEQVKPTTVRGIRVGALPRAPKEEVPVESTTVRGITSSLGTGVPAEKVQVGERDGSRKQFKCVIGFFTLVFILLFALCASVGSIYWMIQLPNPEIIQCLNNGYRTGTVCVCHEGFTGTYCETNLIPPTVTNLQRKPGATTNTLTLTWSKHVHDAVGVLYRGRLDRLDPPSTGDTVNLMGNSQDFFNLKPGAQYKAYIWAVVAGQSFGITESLSVYTEPIPPAVTSLQKKPRATANTLTLTWSKNVNNAAGVLYQGRLDPVDSALTGATVNLTLNSHDFINLRPGAQYKAYILAVVAGQSFGNAESLSVYTDPIPPTVTSLQMKPGATTSTLTLTWSKNVNNAAGVLYQGRLDRVDSASTGATVNLMLNSHDFINLRPGAQYKAYIWAVLNGQSFGNAESLSVYTAIINLLSLPGVSCSASSVETGSVRCEDAFDGDYRKGVGSEWAGADNTSTVELTIFFPRFVTITKVKMWPRCNTVDQSDRVNYIMSSAVYEITRACRGEHYAPDGLCSLSSDPEVVFPVHLNTETYSLTVKIHGKYCRKMVDTHLGVREMEVWGY